jgi:hypothetical protein
MSDANLYPDVAPVKDADGKAKVKLLLSRTSRPNFYRPHDARQLAKDAETKGDKRLAAALRAAAAAAERFR